MPVRVAIKAPEEAHISVDKRIVSETDLGMRVALYARVSTRDKGQDTENQTLQLREYCQKQGWSVIHEFVDHASGKSSKRPEFERLFAGAAKRQFDLVLFWSLDRFSREGAFETMEYLRRLTDAGVDWKSYTEQYLDSASLGLFRDAVLSILATIAKQERVRLSERTIAGLRRAKRNGQELGRPKLVVDRDKVCAMHEEGKNMREIGEAFGISAASVCRMVKGRMGSTQA